MMVENTQAARLHETKLIRSFVLSQRRERMLTLLQSTAGRDKLRRSLAHFKHLDPRFARLIKPQQQTPSAIADLLRGYGAPPRCYVLSEREAADGGWMDLSAALATIVGRGMGSFICCLPGRLAYFESEEPGDRYILKREAGR